MSKSTFKSFLPLAFLLVSVAASARTKHESNGARFFEDHTPKSIELIENKGQWVQEAKFKADVPGGVMFLTDKGFVYNYVSQEDMHELHELTDHGGDLSSQIIHLHAYKVNFEGANAHPTYVKENKKPGYNNYFIGNDPSKWASNVGLFGKVLQKDLYPGVDLALYGKEQSVKYDLIVAPGADPSKIVLTFDGVKPQLTPEGHIKVKTSVNEVVEQAPYTYQVIGGVKKEVRSAYKLQNNKLSFSFPDGYNSNYELVIDPTLVFATFSGAVGGGSGFYGFSTTYDEDGSAYAGCGAYGAGWPVTTGAYQSNYSGAGFVRVVGINKYNATGTNRIYSTYYGGAGPDYVHTMKVNAQGELIIAGSTQSNNLPMLTTAFDNTLGGQSDIFVAHFNSTGTALLGATYLGGNSLDPIGFGFTGAFAGADISGQNSTSPVEINTDAAGNIWVVSNTSSTDFPVTANAQQSTLAGGTLRDGVICKLNPTCSNLLYSSYFGGTGDEGIFSIDFNAAGNLVIAGATSSADFPTTAGAKTTVAPGNLDGFVSIINSATGAILQSTYMGTAGNDQVIGVQVDKSGNIFAFGRTDGAYPVSTGVYSVAGGDVFIDRLTPTLSASQLSTRVGSATGVRFFPDGYLVDICGNTYITGLQASNGMPTTPDAASTNGALPFWFCVLTPNFQSLLYGSYFGAAGDHVHVGTNRLDPNGVVYHSICNGNNNVGTGGTWGNPTLITPGAWGPVNQSAQQDIVTFKFDFEATGVVSNFKLDTLISKNDTGCVPYTIKMVNQTNNPSATTPTTYIWDFGDGSATTTATNPSHTYTTTGTFTITLYAHNDSTCVTDDTTYMQITVLKTELPDIVVRDTTLCSNQQSIPISVQINNPSPNNTILWQPGTGILSNPTLPQITVDPALNNLYYVTVKDTIPGICGFSSTDTVHIDLAPRQLDIINNDTVVCEGAVVPLTVIGTPGYTYKWTPSTGVNDTTLLSPTITINQPNIYTIRASYPGCPDTLASINIGMHYIPTLELGPNKTACQWTDVAFESVVTPYRPDYIYQWTPSAGLSNPTGPNAGLMADTSGTWYLDVKTPIGCAARDSIKLTVYPGNFGAAATDTGYCPPSEVQLWATGGVSYSWTPAYGLSDTAIANPVASPATTTDYTVYIKDIHNCLDTQKLTVTVYPLGILSLPDSVNIYPGEAYAVEPGTNALYFQWFPTSGVSNANIANPTLSPEVRTRYFVTARTEHGCVVTDSMDVLVKETELDMPNAFAPNGTNNVFKPTKRGIAQLKSFTIFNRWGNKVYSSTNIDEGWDGTYNGTNQPMGVYMYILEAVTDKGKPFTKQGNVTLIR